MGGGSNNPVSPFYPPPKKLSPMKIRHKKTNILLTILLSLFALGGWLWYQSQTSNPWNAETRTMTASSSAVFNSAKTN